MHTFQPTKGDKFYLQMKPWNRIVNQVFNDATTGKIVEQVDDSYAHYVFECLASDAHSTIAKPVYGASCGFTHSRVFLNSKSNYFPVGPDVLEALQLFKSSTSEEDSSSYFNKLD